MVQGSSGKYLVGAGSALADRLLNNREVRLPRRKRATLGQPVVHFEIIGRDLHNLQIFYGDLFAWKFDTRRSASAGEFASR